LIRDDAVVVRTLEGSVERWVKILLEWGGTGKRDWLKLRDT